MSAREHEAMRRLAAALDLPFDPGDQDSGIVSSGRERVEEFVRFFQPHDLHPTQCWVLTELILASAEDRLAEEPDADLSIVRDWLAEHPDEAARRWHVDYWSRRRGTALPLWIQQS